MFGERHVLARGTLMERSRVGRKQTGFLKADERDCLDLRRRHLRPSWCAGGEIALQ